MASGHPRVSSLHHQMAELNGHPTLLGIIIATTTKNNHDTATPFNNTGLALSGMTLELSADAICYVRLVTANTGTVTTGATGTATVKLAVDEKYTMVVKGDQPYWLACVSASGTTNLKVCQKE